MSQSSSNYHNPMLGSIHKYSNGYGYGMRMPTERNKVAEKFSVPKYRHLPDSARFLAGTQSKPQILKNEAGDRRNNESIKFLTSGEVGFHTTSAFVDPLTSTSPLSPLKSSRMKNTNSNRSAQTRNIFLSNDSTPRDPADSSRSISSSRSTTSRSTGSNSEPSTTRTARDNKFNIDPPNVSSRLNPFLDNTYRPDNSSSGDKRKLMSHILNSDTSYRELAWAASSNSLAARQSHGWGESLRRS